MQFFPVRWWGVIGWEFLATTCCKNVETLSRKKQRVLLQIAASHRSVRLNSDLPPLPPPPIQSCSSKFWAWSCIASNFEKGWRGVTSTRSWKGHLSQNTVQCLKYFCNWLSHVRYTSKSDFHVWTSQSEDYSEINK